MERRRQGASPPNSIPAINIGPDLSDNTQLATDIKTACGWIADNGWMAIYAGDKDTWGPFTAANMKSIVGALNTCTA